MNKKGQALIEALAAVGLSTGFFIFSVSLVIQLLNEVKKDQQQLDTEICNMSSKPTSFCKKSSTKGFVLISSLMQMMLLLFSIQVIYLLIIYKDLQFSSLTSCFENSLQQIESQQRNSESLSDTLKNKASELNKLLTAIGIVQCSVSNPTLEYSSEDNSLTKVAYNLSLKLEPKNTFHFLRLSNAEMNFKCGAKKECTNQNCLYSIIADKY